MDHDKHLQLLDEFAKAACASYVSAAHHSGMTGAEIAKRSYEIARDMVAERTAVAEAMTAPATAETAPTKPTTTKPAPSKKHGGTNV